MVSYLVPVKTEMDFHDRQEKLLSGNNLFITILVIVRNFWQKSIILVE